MVVFLLYQGASLPDAAEVAQEAMIEAFRQWWTIERPKTWIRTVAARMLLRRVAAVRDTQVRLVATWPLQHVVPADSVTV